MNQFNNLQPSGAYTFILWGLLALIVGVYGCVPPDEEANKEGDKPLVQVYNKTLYLSELAGMVPPSATPGDSSLIVNAYVNRWIKENLLLYEAERNIPKDLNIDKLVRDYRASLIVYNYEKSVMESELDSVITDAELKAYYDEYQSHFKVEGNLRRVCFVRFPKDVPALEQIKGLWGSEYDEDRAALKGYCKKYATIYQLDEKRWLTDDELESELPKNMVKNMKEGAEVDREEGDAHYFATVYEVQSKNGDLPLGYIREQATKYILHQRKIDLLARKRDVLLQRATNKGHVKYFD